jgi:hypothetical protein
MCVVCIQETRVLQECSGQALLLMRTFEWDQASQSATGVTQTSILHQVMGFFYPSTQRRYRRLIYYYIILLHVWVVRPSSGSKYIIS